MNQLYHTAVFNDPHGNMMKYTITKGRVVGSTDFIPFTGLMKPYMDNAVANEHLGKFSDKFYYKVDSFLLYNGEILYNLSWYPLAKINCWAELEYSLTTISTPNDTLKTTRSGKQY